MANVGSRVWLPNGSRAIGLKPIAEAPRDGRELLCTDGVIWRVCRPKEFSEDIWEFFRDERFVPGHTWSMAPTHFIDLADLPQVPK